MSSFYELPKGTATPSLQQGLRPSEDTSVGQYPRLIDIPNGFTVPDSGLVIIQIVGNGSVPKVQINGIPYLLNYNNAVNAGTLNEFDVHVRQGEIVYVDPTTCTVRALFFRRGE